MINYDVQAELDYDFQKFDNETFNDLNNFALDVLNKNYDDFSYSKTLEFILTNDIGCYIDFNDVKDFSGLDIIMTKWHTVAKQYKYDSPESIYYLRNMLGLDYGDYLQEILDNKINEVSP